MTYYPFLRSKQFEMLAIRDLADVPLKHNVVPILEPVRDLTSPPNIRSIQKWIDKDRKICIIANPKVGDMEYFDVSGIFERIEGNSENIILAHFAEQDLDSRILKRIGKRKRIAIVRQPDNVRSLLEYETDNNELIIVTDSSVRWRSVNKPFPSAQVVKLSDPFEKRDRNSDYDESAEDFFSDDPIYYREDRYSGFSDYQTIGSGYTEGGFMPRAVAIHWTIQREGELYIRQFLSDDRTSQGRTKEKFFEAAEKLASYIRFSGLENSASQEFLLYFDEDKFPGLGMLKKISVKNHIEVSALACSEAGNDE